jgi:hypothetical protein
MADFVCPAIIVYAAGYGLRSGLYRPEIVRITHVLAYFKQKCVANTLYTANIM